MTSGTVKHVFRYFDSAKDREHVGPVATKESKLDHVEKFTIRDPVNDIKERGCVELVQPGEFDEPVQIYEAEGSGIESLNCGIESGRVTIAALLCVMRKPDFQCLEMVYEIIRIARNSETPVDIPLDCQRQS